MREIKFRAWDEDGYMFAPKIIVFINGSIQVWDTPTTFGLLGSGVVALMQYTGLKDKTGKEIYEGDIVEISGTIIKKVTFGKHPGDNGGEYGYNWGWSFEEWTMDPEEMDDVEVIGNIYENPELCPTQIS